MYGSWPEKQRHEDSWAFLASHPSLLDDFQARERPSSQDKHTNKNPGIINLKVVLWHPHTGAGTHPHICM